MSEAETAQKPAGRPLRSSVFKYYIHDGVAACRLQLIGDLSSTEISELNGCWRTARTTLGARPLILDLRALRTVDEAGKQWLAGMAQEGATCQPENYLRDVVAGKHVAGTVESQPASKTGLFSRILGALRGTGIAAAK